MMTLSLESPAFRNGERIPTDFTADGKNMSPPLVWSAAPLGTRALALLVEDPDARGPAPFVHWLISDLDLSLARGKLDAGAPQLPFAVEGRNSFGELGYLGPEPPPGSGDHHYHFHLYALDDPLRLPKGFTKEDFLKSVKQQQCLASGELIGTYSR
jgi:Raf kinase inhibitor-like YbhB/YbcL family protein